MESRLVKYQSILGLVSIQKIQNLTDGVKMWPIVRNLSIMINYRFKSYGSLLN